MAAVDECPHHRQWLWRPWRRTAGCFRSDRCGASIIMALQTVVSRNIHPLDAGRCYRRRLPCAAWPATSFPNGRKCCSPSAPSIPVCATSWKERIRMIAEGQAASYGMSVTVNYNRGYEATHQSQGGNRFRPRPSKTGRRSWVMMAEIDLPRPSMGCRGTSPIC